MATLPPFVAGLAAGLSIAAPVGPTAILCITRTLENGFRAGVSTGAGATTVHVAYSGLILLGLGGLGPWVDTNRHALTLFGATLMLLFTFRLLRPRRMIATNGRKPPSTAALYVSAILFSGTNPMLYVLLIGVFAALLGPEPLHGGRVGSLLGGVLFGSFGWWIGLSGLVARLRDRFSSAMLRTVNTASAAAMAGFSLLALARLAGLSISVR